jgi:hypothetical protein
MAKLREHARIKEVLGEPLAPRAWWNASVKKAPDGASCGVYFVVDGPKGSSDVYMRVCSRSTAHANPPRMHCARSTALRGSHASDSPCSSG